MGLTLDAPVIMAAAARTYPLVLLFAVARPIDQPRKKPGNAAITRTPRSSDKLLACDALQRSHGVLRNVTLGKSGNWFDRAKPSSHEFLPNMGG